MTTPQQEVKKEINEKNALAIAETLVHHGKVMEELFQKIANLETRLNTMTAATTENRQLIVTALQNRYGHGSTQVDDGN